MYVRDTKTNDEKAFLLETTQSNIWCACQNLLSINIYRSSLLIQSPCKLKYGKNLSENLTYLLMDKYHKLKPLDYTNLTCTGSHQVGVMPHWFMYDKWYDQLSGWMSRASASCSGRSGNPKDCISESGSCGFETWLSEIKDFKIYTCHFLARWLALWG